jgi:hypothetical protein
MKKAAKVLIVSVGAASVLGIGTAAALFNQVETLYGPPTDIPSLEDTASQAESGCTAEEKPASSQTGTNDHDEIQDLYGPPPFYDEDTEEGISEDAEDGINEDEFSDSDDSIEDIDNMECLYGPPPDM